ncbi:MAG: ABC transporter ATP-binding protein [Pseudomonadota bacterium]
MSEPALELINVDRAYGDLKIFDDVSLTVAPGEIVALVGPSGSGKSSLLHIAGLLEAPTAGEVKIAGRPCVKLSDAARTRIRGSALGFVYQFHHLLPEFSALGNVALPQMIAGASKRKAEEEARRLLSSLGLAERLSHQPAQLSGGEQQRVAIARALANGPRVLLADEPTGNLDPKTSEDVFASLLEIVRGEGLAALIATHDYNIADRMDRILEIKDRRLSVRDDGVAAAQ